MYIIQLLFPCFQMNQVLILNEILVLPDDLAKRMNVSSIVLSTALSAPGITAIAPLVTRSLAPGCVFSMFVRWTSSQTRYLRIRRDTDYVWKHLLDECIIFTLVLFS